MTTLEDLKAIAKADDSEDKKENPFEKKAEDEKPEEKEVEKTADEKDDKEETNKAILAALKSIVARQDKMEKAMETPTDLPQSPKGTADSEDVGDKVTAPKDPYPTGDQAGLHDDTGSEDKPESDKGDLKMQEKSVNSHVTSPVERPAHQEVAKSNTKQDLISYQVLQKCRSAGYQNLSEVGKSLMDIADRYDKEGTL
ncbi:MAG: hypothetical protein H8D23_05165 [Candidatus Brocadiales bacterium]|nr:hypothetical protein [Candidatus Brocadiales bacterium]